jgi:hypothetical protein
MLCGGGRNFKTIYIKTQRTLLHTMMMMALSFLLIITLTAHFFALA